MKKQVDTIDAVPSKRIFLSIISDYDLNRSICELVDNAIDNWIKNEQKNNLKVEIVFNLGQQTISITDNSGGLPRADIKFVIGPGQTGNDPSDVVIGIFGVGTKRAVVALAQDIKISTRYGNNATYRVEFDDSWLQDDDWRLPVYEIDNILAGSTNILLQRLRNPITENNINYLKKHLQRTYAKFISGKKIAIFVDAEELRPVIFENWAFPPGHLPQKVEGYLNIEGKKIKINILAGLSRESSPAEGEYGVYFYCNNRLIARAVKSFAVGFTRGIAGLPHPSISLVRVIVELEGAANLMPWNSSKSAINYNNHTFLALREALIQILKHFTSLSRAFEGEWPSKVFKYDSGEIIVTPNFDFPTVKNLNLPPVPRSKYRYEETLEQINKKILNAKPWTRGLLGGVIATDIISNKSFDEKNRVALIVLDSTLEIAFKEYLVNESRHHYTNVQLLSIFSRRHLVIDEIKRYIHLSDTIWGKINHYYDLRCKLVHERASVGISDSQIQEYRSVVHGVLKVMFKLKFE